MTEFSVLFRSHSSLFKYAWNATAMISRIEFVSYKCHGISSTRLAVLWSISLLACIYTHKRVNSSTYLRYIYMLYAFTGYHNTIMQWKASNNFDTRARAHAHAPRERKREEKKRKREREREREMHIQNKIYFMVL